MKALSRQNKERILKSATQKRQVTYKDKPIKIIADFSIQTVNTRRLWKDIIQILKESNYKFNLVYPAKLSFGKIAGYKINIEKSVGFLHTNNSQTEKEIREIISFSIASKSVKYLRINFYLFISVQ
jgi:hypothetical protein